MAATSRGGLTITAAFRAAAARVPSRVAISFGEHDYTYAELDDRSARLAAALLGKASCPPGARVGVLLPNGPRFLIAVLAIARAGLASVPIPLASTPREVGHIVQDGQLAMVLTESAVLDRLGTELEEVTGPGVVHAWDQDLPGAPSLSGMMLDAPRSDLDLAQEDAPFFVGYTSGTTGRPKGAVVSHRARTLLSLAYGQEYGCYAPGERHLIATPMYHGAGLTRALAPLLAGASVEVHAGFDPERVLHAIGAGRATATFMVPTMFASLFQLPERVLDGGRSSTLRTILSNASALPEFLKVRILDQWPEARLFEIYGSTEAGTVSSLRPEDQRRKQRCVGLPMPLTEVKLLTSEGEEVAPGEVGSVHARSPYLFSGYLGNRVATDEVMRDGYLNLGDLARRDEEGYLYVVGRSSEVIISGGVNVYPREVEEYLAEQPGVREVAVFGVPDPYWGEAVHAVIVPDPSSPTPSVETLLQFCRRGLAPAKIPKHFLFRQTLPRTPTGKIAKRELRKEVARKTGSENEE